MNLAKKAMRNMIPVDSLIKLYILVSACCFAKKQNMNVLF